MLCWGGGAKPKETQFSHSTINLGAFTETRRADVFSESGEYRPHSASENSCCNNI
jgi:hypothetical protein